MADADGQPDLMAALGRVPSGLFILTARQGAHTTGMLSSWVQQCSMDPPMVSVALQRDRDILAWLADGVSFALNIVGHGQKALVRHFGKGFELGEPAFDGLAVDLPSDGPPVLRDALGYLLCRVGGRCRSGDHELVLARVVGGTLFSDAHPMVHVRKKGSHY